MCLCICVYAHSRSCLIVYVIPNYLLWCWTQSTLYDDYHQLLQLQKMMLLLMSTFIILSLPRPQCTPKWQHDKKAYKPVPPLICNRWDLELSRETIAQLHHEIVDKIAGNVYTALLKWIRMKDKTKKGGSLLCYLISSTWYIEKLKSKGFIIFKIQFLKKFWN